MTLSLSSVSPDGVDAAGGAKLTIEGDFSEHVGQDFTVELVLATTQERIFALTGKPGSPRTIQPLNAERMVCYVPRLQSQGDLLFADPLAADLGWWEYAKGFASVTFAGGWAQVNGNLYPDIPPAAEEWSGYRVAAEIRATSAYSGVLGLAGLTGHGSNLTNSGVFQGINAFDNKCHSVIVPPGAVAIYYEYPYSPFGTLVNGQIYQLELRLEVIDANSIRTHFFVDGQKIFSQVIPYPILAGLPGFAGSSSAGNSSEFRNFSAESLTGQAGRFLTSYDLVVSRSDASATATLSEAIQAFPRQYNSSVFGYRSTLPPTYRTGPRRPGQLERIT